MAELLLVQLVDTLLALAVRVAMVSHVVSGQAKNAVLVVSDVVVGVELAPCLTSGQVRESTYKKPPTSMLVMEAISTWCGRGETSHVSSRVVAS